MVFSSTVFLFIFLPAVWAICFFLPRRFITAKNVALALASLVFYAFGEPVYVLIMLASVTFNYFAALLMERMEHRENAKKILCAVAVIVNLSLLALFKYVPWLVTMFNSAAHTSIPVPALTIPVGISFYTFQILSYVIDVERGKVSAQHNYVNLFLYISFFPQLIAGPIVKYSDISAQITERTVTVDKTARGVRRFIVGFSKKVLVSNSVAVIADAAFGAGSPSSLLLWCGAAAYCLQLYFDFSGYSDMAIGLASMFGFELNENFNYPYSAVSVNDFWKRWHISLTSWFREYVYFSLGGSRCSRARAMLNRFIVFALSGLWHGANLTYLLWGIWHGILMVLEQLTGLNKLAEKRAFRPFTRIYTLLCVLLGFVLFRAESVGAAFDYIKGMFSFTGGYSDATLYFSPWTVVVIVSAVIFSLPVIPFIREKLATTERRQKILSAVSYVAVIPLFALSVGMLASSSFNPFIYYIF